jgi:hypothetical protein
MLQGGTVLGSTLLSVGAIVDVQPDENALAQDVVLVQNPICPTKFVNFRF